MYNTYKRCSFVLYFSIVVLIHLNVEILTCTVLIEFCVPSHLLC